ncbi:hypothetical protein BHE74_00059125, partial [Ensete ventricosum]
EFRSVFRAPSQNFKILVIPNVFAERKSYEHGFTKNATVINFAQSHAQGQVPSIFHAPSRNFKILAIPNVLALGKL